MKALVLEGIKNLTVKNVDDPEPGPAGVLIRVMANGVCRSDWHAWVGDFKRDFPVIMGHEMTGIVEEVRPGVSTLKKGDRVIVPFTGSDGTCPHCRKGLSHLCDSPSIPGKSYTGGYAEYVSVPNADRNVVKLPEIVSFTDGAALGCRFMTAFHGLVNQAKVRPGEWVVVYGCGVVGLSAINIASALGAQVIGVDINIENLHLAQTLGASHVIDSTKTDAVGAVTEITKGGAHISVDALGMTETCVNGMLSLRKAGRHLQLGITSKKEAGYISIPIDLFPYKEIVLLGAHGMPAHDFSALLPMVEQKRLTPGKLVNGEISLSDVAGVFEAMTNSKNVGAQVVTKFY